MRLDRYLVDHCGVRSRSLAASLITEGWVRVLVDQKEFTKIKPSSQVGENWEVSVLPNPLSEAVSRGSLKLAAALERTGWNLKNWQVLDVGQSTGGFTEVCLKRGAEWVVGVDSGHDQLAESLKQDPRVHCLEKVNAKDLSPSWFSTNLPEKELSFDLIVVDVSFISLRKIESLWDGLAPRVVALVKPQFEQEDKKLFKSGVLPENYDYSELEKSFRIFCQSRGFEVKDYFESSIRGGDGNREFFVVCEKATQE